MAYLGNSPGVASQRVVTTFTATAGQTVFTPQSGYTLGYCDVFLNGIKLVNGDDYTASNGTSITLASGAAVGDSVEVVAYFPRGLSDGYLKSEADAKYVAKTGDTMTGVLRVPNTLAVGNSPLQYGSSGNLGAELSVQSSPTTHAAVSVQSGLSRFFIGTRYNDNRLMIGANGASFPSGDSTIMLDTDGQITTPYQVSFNVGGSAYGGDFVSEGDGAYLKYNQINDNTYNCFNSTTGLFTAPRAGRYMFRAHQLSANMTQSGIILFMRINGSVYHECYINNATSHATAQVGGIYKLAAGDNVGICVNAGSHWYRGSNAHSQFSGFLLG